MALCSIFESRYTRHPLSPPPIFTPLANPPPEGLLTQIFFNPSPCYSIHLFSCTITKSTKKQTKHRLSLKLKPTPRKLRFGSTARAPKDSFIFLPECYCTAKFLQIPEGQPLAQTIDRILILNPTYLSTRQPFFSSSLRVLQISA